MKAILGLDIGTTTICGVGVSTSGELLVSVERPNDSAVAGLPTGRAEQDPRRIRERVLEVLAELGGRISDVAGIGITGQMHGMMCLDEGAEPLGNLVTWQDGRCLEPDAHGRSSLEQMRILVPARVWDGCGCLPASGFMGSTLFWLSRDRAALRGVVRVSFAADWIAGSLTEQMPVTDPSHAGSAGVFNLAAMGWHRRICEALDLPVELLPPVRESGEVIGRLSAATARATGLPAGTPVCNAIGDNQASVLGSIAQMDNSVLVNLGTGGQISWAIPAFSRAEGMETRYLPMTRYMLVGASLCGGRALAWLNDVVREWIAPFAGVPDRETVYARLVGLASLAPGGAGGLTARTTLAGTRADPLLRGSFEGVSLDNFKLGNVARAVLEGIIEELCAFYRASVGERDSDHTVVVASGNAVRKNPLFREIISSRFGLPVVVPKHREEASFGAALLAGVSTGVWPDLGTAGQHVGYAAHTPP
ncbi:MAG TPA: FGGY family carbohydrate kinase [Phycisphaerae bacterium]|nr:FGGY family carbohydrate kinase [Phycisphaerae bacterium]HRY69965.1 FGGY family carbohydrate kinase [Phycisphaerae bacterium]HSA27174.1 FGGY family carbohydrate kinase [Phycisphaerae bacterium]